MNQARPVTRAMLDVLADGAPHPTEALLLAGTKVAMEEGRGPGEILRLHKRRAREGTPAPDTTDPARLRAACRGIAQNSLNLLQGRQRVMTGTDNNGLSVSIAAHDVLTEIRAHYAKNGIEIPTRPDVLFGGYTEADGWACAPLRLHDQFHFRSADDLPIAKILKALPAHVTLRLEPDGLYRGTCQAGTGQEITDRIKAWCASHGLHQTDMRPEPMKLRRDLRELPQNWLNDLCRYHKPTNRSFINRHSSQIKVHVPETDDVHALVDAWFLEAVTRYDPDLTTEGGAKIPFSGYVRTILRKEAHDLPRKAHGRRAADLELRLARANAQFEQTHQRQPDDAEVADMLGITVEQARARRLEVHTLRNMRHSNPLDTGPDAHEIPLPAEGHVDDGIAAQDRATILCMAMVNACAYSQPISRPVPEGDGTGDEPTGTLLAVDEVPTQDVRFGGHNVLGLVSLLQTMHGPAQQADLAAMYDVSKEDVAIARDAATPRMKELIHYMGGIE